MHAAPLRIRVEGGGGGVPSGVVVHVATYCKKILILGLLFDKFHEFFKYKDPIFGSSAWTRVLDCY